eukprot:g5023.t1
MEDTKAEVSALRIIVDEETAGIQALEGKFKALEKECKDRIENLERIDERTKQASEEVRMGDALIANLRSNQGKRYQRDDASTAEMNRVPNGRRTPTADPSSSFRLIMNHLRSVGAKLGQNESGRNGLEQNGEGLQSMDRLVDKVTVFLPQKNNESGIFRITPEYTFRDLCKDACRYWSVDDSGGTLRDEMNMLWPPRAHVAVELSRQKNAEVRLVARIWKDTQEKGELDSMNDETGNGTGLREHQRNLYMEATEGRNIVETEERANAVIKRWTEQRMQRLSPRFHEPHIRGTESRFSALSRHTNRQDKLVFENMKVLVQVIIHAVIMSAMVYSLLSRRQVLAANEFSRAVHGHVAHQPSAITRATTAQSPAVARLYGTSSVQGFWAWAEGPLTSLLLRGSGAGLHERATPLGLIPIGGLHFRQYRAGSTVDTGGCSINEGSISGAAAEYASIIFQNGCAADFTMTGQLRYAQTLPRASVDADPNLPIFTALGVDDVVSATNATGFEFGTEAATSSFPFTTASAYYGRSSFYTELLADGEDAAKAARRKLLLMRRREWIDTRTRAVSVTFNLLSLNKNALICSRFIFEFLRSGGVESQSLVYTIPLSAYGQSMGEVSASIIMDSIVGLYALHILYNEIITGLILYGRRRYFVCLWAWIDTAYVASVVIATACWVAFQTVIVPQMVATIDDGVYREHFSTTRFHSTAVNASTFSLLMGLLRTLKYFQRNLSVSKVWQAISITTTTLSGLFFTLAILLCSFISFAYFVFGTEIVQFSSLIGSFDQMLRMLSGDMPYAEMVATESIAGPVFFSMFAIAIIIIMGSLFVATFVDAYVVAEHHIDDSHDTFWRDFATLPYKCFRMRKRKNEAGKKRQAKQT